MDENSYRYVGKLISKSHTAIELTAQHWTPKNSDTQIFRPCTGCNLLQSVQAPSPTGQCSFKIDRINTILINPGHISSIATDRKCIKSKELTCIHKGMEQPLNILQPIQDTTTELIAQRNLPDI